MLNRDKYKYLFLIVGILFWIGCQTDATQTQNQITSKHIRQTVEGTWQLESWHIGDEVVRAPEAHGYWSLHNGTVLFTVYRTDGDTTFTSFGNGAYNITDSTWSYRYDHFTNLIVRGSGDDQVVEVDHPLLREGWPRVFEAKRESGKLVLDNEQGLRQSIYEGD